MLFTYGPMETLLIYQHLSSLVPVVIWEPSFLDACMRRSNTTAEPGEHETDEWKLGDQGGRTGCMQTEGFPESIPLWKSFAWHYGPDSLTPWGSQWTLAPEDYGAGQTYLGGISAH